LIFELGVFVQLADKIVDFDKTVVRKTDTMLKEDLPEKTFKCGLAPEQ
jgi:hypothetical protein